MGDDRMELHFIILSQDAGGIIGREGRLSHCHYFFITSVWKLNYSAFCIRLTIQESTSFLSQSFYLIVFFKFYQRSELYHPVNLPFNLSFTALDLAPASCIAFVTVIE